MGNPPFGLKSDGFVDDGGGGGGGGLDFAGCDMLAGATLSTIVPA